MEAVNLYDAKTRLSELLRRVEHGEEVVICRAGRQIAQLVPVKEVTVERRPGRGAGRGKILAGFDDALPEAWRALFPESL